MRLWLRLGVGLDLILLLPALYFVLPSAVSAFQSGSPKAIALGALFAFLPIICVAAPLSARHAWAKGREAYALTILGAPVIYGAYLLVFLRPF